MQKKKIAKSENLETLPEKAIKSISTAFLICLGLIIFFMVFLAFFMKGVVSGWF